MVEVNEWCVAVFKCTPDIVKKVLVDIYRFVNDLKGVQSFHFLSRDRVDDEVVFSFRLMIEPKLKEIVKSKLAYKLGTLLPEEKFAIDPALENNLQQYVAWSPKKLIEEMGPLKFKQYIVTRKNMSTNIVQMIENNYFESSDRIEIAYTVSQMLGCTEYGALYPSKFEVGYYDRLDDKYCPKLAENLVKPNKRKVALSKKGE